MKPTPGAGQLWAALVVLLSAWILHSFLEPLLWASVIAVATWPIYRRFSRRLPARAASSAAPLLFTMLVTLFVLGPLMFAVGALTLEMRSLADQIVAADRNGLATPGWLESTPVFGAWLADQWSAILGVPGGVSAWLRRPDTPSVLGWAQTMGHFIAHHVLVIVFTILVLFLLFRDGEALAQQLVRLIHDLLGERADSYLRLSIAAVRATVTAMVIVGLLDGVLSFAIYALAGVQQPGVWGALTGVCSMIPFLGYLAVLGAAAALMTKGSGGAALFVCAAGLASLFIVDKFVRPMLIRSTVNLGFVWILIGSLGGFEVLGTSGILIGPVVLALFGALWHEWTGARSPSAADSP